MSYRIIALFLLFLCGTAYSQSDQMALDVGIGILNSAYNSLSETKTLSLGIQEDLYGPLKQRGTVGLWIDNAGHGRSGSAFVSGQLGFEVDREGLIAGVFSGPALLSDTDVYLGGHFQFMDDIRLGLQDKQNNYIGVFYRHFSSA